MSISLSSPSLSPALAATQRRTGRSIGAVLAGLAAVFVLSMGTDQVFHALDVYPPWGQPMRSTGLFVLALAYRTVFNVFGGYLTARLAPHRPMKHALLLGGIGVVLSIAGAIAAMSADLGPVWYALALVVEALPCAWLGGRIYLRRAG